MHFSRITAVGVAAVAALVAAPLVGPSAQAQNATASPGSERVGDRPGKPLTVMTRNIYLGADINRPVLAAQRAAAQPDATQASIIQALAVATDATRAIVDQTNFPVRSKLLAGEIAETEPDLVGLQEVALWRSGPFNPAAIANPSATTVDYDFLDTLLDDLEALGADYDAVKIGARADVEAPAFTATGQNMRNVRLTMHDVILKKADNSFRVTGSDDVIFDHNLPVNIAGVNLNFSRGYQWVDVMAGKKKLRFVNSHFEAFSSDLALAQAMQTLGEATATDRTTVFVCDCNSDPLNNDIKPIDHVPHKAPYDFITGPGDYTDQWLEWAPAEEGWTAGLSELVNDATPAKIDHRIDMIFSHTLDGEPLATDWGTVTGDEVADRDPATGLWPSDHAGVVLRLRGW
jgi:endonuclease/exonuclease/phosphatase family metal-dependent hydrolase